MARTRTRTRSLLGTGILAVTALLLSAAPADAGLLPSLTGAETCNTETGEYEVVFTQTTPSDTQSVAITVTTYQVDGADATPPTFSPNPMPPAGQATAAVTVPGSTTSILLETLLTGDLINIENSLELTLDGDCQATSTTTTTIAETTTTTTTAPAAQAVERRPAFTG